MAFALVQHINSGAYAAADASGNLSVSFAVTVTSGNNVRGWCQWGSAIASEFVSVSDDKGNSYTISDKILGTTNSQSLGSFHAENLTNAPKTITVHYGQANEPGCAIIIEEWSGEDNSGTAINAHGGQRQVSPGTTTDAVTTGNITTNVDGCNICGTAGDVAGTSTALAVGTGYTISDDDYANIKDISEHKTQATQGAVAATFTMTTASNEVLSAVMAAKPATAAIGVDSVQGPYHAGGVGMVGPHGRRMFAQAYPPTQPIDIGVPAITIAPFRLRRRFRRFDFPPAVPPSTQLGDNIYVLP